jgi:hypothetical protein
VVETGAETLIFDLGFRAVRGMRRFGIHPSRVNRVFFTHFHGDHTVDVIPFLFWRRLGARDMGRTSPSRPFSMSGPEPFLRFWGSWGRWLLGGSPAEISERVDAHLDAGADHVCLNVLDADPNALPIGSWRALAPALLGR